MDAVHADSSFCIRVIKNEALRASAKHHRQHRCIVGCHHEQQHGPVQKVIMQATKHGPIHCCFDAMWLIFFCQ